MAERPRVYGSVTPVLCHPCRMDGRAWEHVQQRFLARVRGAADLERGTIVVLPSISFPHTELRKITGIQHYEERLLCFVLLLSRPDVRIVYITSLPVDR